MRVELLGFYLDALTMAETIEAIDKHLSSRTVEQPLQHVVVNAGKIMLMQQNERLRRIVRNCRLVNADGMSVVWAGRLLGHKIPERVAGADLMFRVVELAAERNYSIYLLGATRDVCNTVAEVLRRRYPRLQIVGCHHGYFDEQDEAEVLGDIRESRADILFVAIGSPKKEYWLADHLDTLGVRFAMGVGGTFDVIAGKVLRAPIWMQQAGLEWFFRLIQEPRRMWRRYLVGNTQFILLVLRAWVGGPMSSGPAG